MKAAAISLGILMMTGALLTGPVHAQASASVFARSPDHPKTWVVGALRDHQSLRWSVSKQMLLALVTYSTAAFADGPHPTEEDDFSLSFPTVHFNPASNQFTAHGVIVATMHHGLFGDEVTLDPKIQLSIHRHHGVVYAALIHRENDSF